MLGEKGLCNMFCSMLNCRASHAEFVIPYQKYAKSLTNPVTIGTRFKMRFEMDDSPERRFLISFD
jgi:hypothetical protein